MRGGVDCGVVASGDSGVDTGRADRRSLKVWVFAIWNLGFGSALRFWEEEN
jgi:hypothetical protein